MPPISKLKPEPTLLVRFVRMGDEIHTGVKSTDRLQDIVEGDQLSGRAYSDTGWLNFPTERGVKVFGGEGNALEIEVTAEGRRRTRELVKQRYPKHEVEAKTPGEIVPQNYYYTRFRR